MLLSAHKRTSIELVLSADTFWYCPGRSFRRASTRSRTNSHTLWSSQNQIGQDKPSFFCFLLKSVESVCCSGKAEEKKGGKNICMGKGGGTLWRKCCMNRAQRVGLSGQIDQKNNANDQASKDRSITGRRKMLPRCAVTQAPQNHLWKTRLLRARLRG